MVRNDPACAGCRGRGWKLIRSRRALAVGLLTCGAAEAKRRTCQDCDGTGLAQ